MYLRSISTFLILIFLTACVSQTQSAYEVITVENASNLVEVQTWTKTNGDYFATTFNPDGSELVLALNNGQLEFVSTQTLETLRVIEGIETAAEWLSYNPDGKELLLSNRRGVYTLLEVESGEILAINTIENLDTRFYPTHDVRKFVREDSLDDRVTVYDAITGQELLSVSDVPRWNVSYDGTMLLTRNAGMIVQIWDIESGEIIFEIMPPGDNVSRDDASGAGFTPDGLIWVNYPQYTETDGQLTWYSPIQFWDMSSGEVVLELEGDQFYSSLYFEPTNTYVLAWSVTQNCWMWNISTTEEITCFGGGNSTVEFSPDGQITAINSGTSPNVYLREIGNRGRPIAVLETPSTWFAEFSPNGKFLVTIDFEIHLWAVPSD